MNQSKTDLHKVLVFWWIAWIWSINFKIWYIFDQKHNAANRLYCQPPIIADLAEAETQKDIDNFIFAKLNGLCVLPIIFNKPIFILADNYLNNF